MHKVKDSYEVYMGFDPGLTTGVAILDKEGNLVDYGQYKFDELIKFFREIPYNYQIKKIVIENFVTYRHKAMVQTGSKQDASKAIGAIQVWAKLNFLPLPVMQMASVLPIAEKWSGQTMKGQSHDRTHWISAYLHIYYYMVKNKIIQTKLEKRANNEASE